MLTALRPQHVHTTIRPQRNVLLIELTIPGKGCWYYSFFLDLLKTVLLHFQVW